MNLLWVAALAFLVLIERLAPGGGWLARAAGVPTTGWGLWLLLETVPSDGSSDAETGNELHLALPALVTAFEIQ